MSNEFLTMLMDPFEKLPESVGPATCDAKTFGDCEHQDEMCTWVAKWYLDSYLSDWMDFEDQGTNSVSVLDAIIAENNPEEAFWSNSMACCKNVLHAIGITQIDELDSDEAGIDFGYITTKQVGIYFRKHVEDILDKILAIYAARNEHAIDEADKENRESDEPDEPEIPENLKKLRDPLNTEDINIFELLPEPVYGATTDVTTDDFILWFAKKMVSQRESIAIDNIIDRLHGEHGLTESRALADPSCEDYVKLMALLGVPSESGCCERLNKVARVSLLMLWQDKAGQIISKVREIMKLWLVHDLI